MEVDEQYGRGKHTHVSGRKKRRNVDRGASVTLPELEHLLRQYGFEKSKRGKGGSADDDDDVASVSSRAFSVWSQEDMTQTL